MGMTRGPRGQTVVMIAAVIFAVSAVIGCGTSSRQSAGGGKLKSSSTTTSLDKDARQERSHTSSRTLPRVSMEVTIPILLKTPLIGIPGRYTCDGTDISFPVRWSGVPRGTAELALFASGLLPIHGESSFVWAIMGLKPTSHGISAGRVPVGAVVGRNSLGKTGYSICPPKGRRETYFVQLLALPRPIHAMPGFEANALFNRTEAESRVVGLAAAAYARQ